jgi:hypothetical protein
VALFHVTQALGRVGQWVGPVEDRCQLPVLDEFVEGEEVLPLLRGRDPAEPLPDEPLTTAARSIEPIAPTTAPGEPPAFSSRVPAAIWTA